MVHVNAWDMVNLHKGVGGRLQLRATESSWSGTTAEPTARNGGSALPEEVHILTRQGECAGCCNEKET